MAGSYKPTAVFVLICLAFTVFAMLFLRPQPRFRIGEQQIYGIYLRGNKIGTLTTRIVDNAIVENAECYVARYSLVTGNTARAGELKFDKDGNLRRAAIAEAENLSLKWRTDVGYSFADKLMYVIVEDNRNPENYRENDVLINLTAEIMVPEHVWYLIRLEPLREDYRREFHINILPDATFNVRAAIRVIGEETIETPTGSFGCWVLEGENTRLASWPIDKLWVAKGEGFVVKAIEWQDNTQVEYVLESRG